MLDDFGRDDFFFSLACLRVGGIEGPTDSNAQAGQREEEAREHAKKNGEGGGLFAQAKRDLAA
ncbi:MAG: hypothetical protein AAFY28_17250, partial [Actinomycetota bacterium]